jgi:hypothetical protein
MSQIFGDFITDFGRSEDDNIHLSLTFAPTRLPRPWLANGLSADFLAHYFALFFSQPPLPTGSGWSANYSLYPAETFDLQNEVNSIISYIANELIENMVKYHAWAEQDVSFTLIFNRARQEFIFLTVNHIHRRHFPTFRNFICELLTDNPTTLLVNRLEQSARQLQVGSSGVGLLTIASDYAARLAWKFEEVPQAPRYLKVITQVLLSVPQTVGVG